MKVELKKVSQAGNNAVAEMFFDGIRVATIHCTPRELIELEKLTNATIRQ